MTQPIPFNLIVISSEMEHTGTISTRRFDSHPECLVFPLEYQTGTKYSRNVMIPYIHPVRYAWGEYPEGTTFERALDLTWNEELKTFLRCRRRSKFRDVDLVMKEERLGELYLKYCDELKGTKSFRAVVTEALLRASIDAWENYKRPANPRFYVAYNPGMVADTDKIMADFPACHMIHVVRNPFSAYFDYLKRPYPQQTLEEYCLAYNVAHHLAYNYSVKYPNFHLVRTEDLMATPKETFTPILDKIGMTWDDALLYPSFNGKDLSDHLPPFGTVEKPTTAYNKAAAASLSPETKDRIFKECALLIQTFDYADYAK